MRVGPFTDGYLPEPSDVTTPVRWLKEELEQLGHVATLYAPHGTAGRRTMPPASSASAHGLLLSTRPYASPSPTTAERRGRSGISTSCTATLLSRWGSSHWRRDCATASRASTPTARASEYRHHLPRALPPPRKTAEDVSAASCNRRTAVTAPSTPIKEELLRHGGRSAPSCSG